MAEHGHALRAGGLRSLREVWCAGVIEHDSAICGRRPGLGFPNPVRCCSGQVVRPSVDTAGSFGAILRLETERSGR